MNDSSRVQVAQSQRHLCYVKSHNFLFETTESIQVKAQVAAEHQVENHEQVLIVLECET